MASENQAERATHRHKKRGTEYVLLGIGKMQTADWVSAKDMADAILGDGPPATRNTVDMREVAIYQSVRDGSWWVRPREEFEDGRFEEIASLQPSPTKTGVADGQ
jgi:hypothetical protein